MRGGRGRRWRRLRWRCWGRGLGERTAGSGRRDLKEVAGTMTEEDARAIEETVRWMDEGDLAAQR